jgi:transcription antitermination factor NusG
MPGYLFLAESRLIEWGLLRDERRFPHVGRPLCSTVGPLHIPARIVVKIHQDEVDGKFDETGATKKSNRAKLEEQFAAGLQVRVGEGPFMGFLAICDGITAQGRIKALVNIFGRLTSVDFEAGQLEAA